MAATLPEAANELARQMVRDVLDGRVSGLDFNQTSLGKRIGLHQSQINRLYAANSRQGCSVEPLMALAELTGRTHEAVAILSEEDKERVLPPELVEEIKRDPSKIVGIKAARTVYYATGPKRTREEWRGFIDHAERLGSVEPEERHEDALAAELKAKRGKRDRKPVRLAAHAGNTS
jgi:hypothetical protein